MNILSLDASSQATGWATKVNGNLESGVIKIPKSHATKQRIIEMTQKILELIDKYNIDIVVMEEVRRDEINITASKILFWLQGYAVIQIYSEKPQVEFEFMQPTAWRSKIGIQKYAVKRAEQKQKDIQYVKNKYGLTVDDDEADAIGILDAYLGESQSNLDDSFFI